MVFRLNPRRRRSRHSLHLRHNRHRRLQHPLAPRLASAGKTAARSRGPDFKAPCSSRISRAGRPTAKPNSPATSIGVRSSAGCGAPRETDSISICSYLRLQLVEQALFAATMCAVAASPRRMHEQRIAPSPQQDKRSSGPGPGLRRRHSDAQTFASPSSQTAAHRSSSGHHRARSKSWPCGLQADPRDCKSGSTVRSASSLRRLRNRSAERHAVRLSGGCQASRVRFRMAWCVGRTWSPWSK